MQLSATVFPLAALDVYTEDLSLLIYEDESVRYGIGQYLADKIIPSISNANN